MSSFAAVLSTATGGFAVGVVFGGVVLGPRVYLTGRAARGPAYGPAARPAAAPGVTAHAQPQPGAIPVTVTVVAAPQLGPASGSVDAYGVPQPIPAHIPTRTAGIGYTPALTGGSMISNRPGQTGPGTTPQETGHE